jgi:hypothetical protein
MLQLLAADAAENGAEVIRRVREEKPAVWLQCICSLLPKQLAIEKVNPLADLTDSELEMIERVLRSEHAKTIDAAKNGAAVIEASIKSEKQTEEYIPNSSPVKE